MYYLISQHLLAFLTEAALGPPTGDLEDVTMHPSFLTSSK